MQAICVRSFAITLKYDRRQDNTAVALQWRHDEHDDVSNHQLLDCLLNRLFRLRSKKTPKLCVTGICEGNPPVTGRFPHKRPVTRKMFPFNDVIMELPVYSPLHLPYALRYTHEFDVRWHGSVSVLVRPYDKGCFPSAISWLSRAIWVKLNRIWLQGNATRLKHIHIALHIQLIVR